MNISALICIDQDIEYLPLVLEQIYDLVEEIVIIDGPYRWVSEFYVGLPFVTSAPTPHVEFRGSPLLSHKKVRYEHREWENEQQKRAYGYDICTCEFVLVIDSDELIVFLEDELDYFMLSSDPIAKLDVFSLGRTYARIEFPVENIEEVRTNPDIPHECYRLFRKSALNGVDHLPYLQVLSIPPAPPLPQPDREVLHPVPIGTIYHLSVMRTGTSNLFKYRFYVAANNVTNNWTDSILTSGKWANYSEMLRDITLDEYSALLMRGRSDSLRCPDQRVVTHYSGLPERFAAHIRYADDVFDEFGTSLDKPLPLLEKNRTFFHLPISLHSGGACRIIVEGVRELTAIDHPFYYMTDNRRAYFPLRVTHESTTSFIIEIPALEPKTEKLFGRMLVLLSHIDAERRFGRLNHIEIIQ